MVYAKTLLQERVSHNRSLEMMDLVWGYCGDTHYVGAGKCFMQR